MTFSKRIVPGFLLAFTLLSSSLARMTAADLVINEFMAANGQTLKDQDGAYSDWIELVNAGQTTLNLANYALTDDAATPLKFRLPDRNLDPGQFLIVFASGKDRSSPTGEVHANFSLDADGEYLALINVQTRAAVTEFAPAFPPQRRDVAYGFASGINPPSPPVYLSVATPGKTNSSGFSGFIPEPLFSMPRGFFDAPFTLGLSNALEGSTIRFTLDGSAPSETNGQTYTLPIAIEASTVVRAYAAKPGYLSSAIQTHTYISLRQTIAQSKTPAGFPTTWNGVTADYAMDPRITGPNTNRMEASLRSLPSLFISTSVSNLFDRLKGIYANPESHGTNWERPASLELVETNGQTKFQVNCGLRIQGGYFRAPSVTQKHSLRVLFKDDYGPSKFKFPLFDEPGAVKEFDTLVLRAGANDGYSWDAAKDTEQFIRDEFGRRLHLQMGHPASHGRFVHLYLNGLYWGLYNLCERPNENFSASYFGGQPEEWDSVNAGDIKNGSLQAWNSFISLVTKAATFADYEKLQGNDLDEKRNPTFPVYLDKTNYIDYMIANIWGGNWDWPNKNFWFGRQRTTNSTGFKFYMWDFENTMGNNLSRSPLNMVSPRSDIATTWVGQPHATLKRLPEYRLDFADRVQRHFFNAGVLTTNALISRYRALADHVESAIISETARWGDDNLSTPQTLTNWLRERDWILTNYLPQRSAIVLQQFRTAGLFPPISAPDFNRPAGAVPFNSEVQLSASKGTIYYTTDGSDPRLRSLDGTPATNSPSALVFTSPIRISGVTTIKTRAFDGKDWSALNEALFVVGGAKLVATEINYHPGQSSAAEIAAGFDNDEHFEFLELLNAGDIPLDLRGTRFTQGIQFDFPDSTQPLAPGAPLLLVANRAGFQFRYGTNLAIGGEYQGNLSNGGETITVVNALGETILNLNYSDSTPWPKGGDGDGKTIELLNPTGGQSDPANWAVSTTAGGTPGRTSFASAIRFLRLTRDNAQLRFEFSGQSQTSYVLQSADSLNPAVWQDVQSIDTAANPTGAQFAIPLPTAVRARFYRLLKR